jgi:hypothetical protein
MPISISKERLSKSLWFVLHELYERSRGDEVFREPNRATSVPDCRRPRPTIYGRSLYMVGLLMCRGCISWGFARSWSEVPCAGDISIKSDAAQTPENVSILIRKLHREFRAYGFHASLWDVEGFLCCSADFLHVANELRP